jgi:hypothetical protein
MIFSIIKDIHLKNLHIQPTNRQTDKQTNRQTDKQTNRQTDKQTNRQTDKQTNRQTDKQTNYKMEIIITKTIIATTTTPTKKIHYYKKNKSYKFCEDIFKIIKEYAGIYNNFPINLIDLYNNINAKDLVYNYIETCNIDKCFVYKGAINNTRRNANNQKNLLFLLNDNATEKQKNEALNATTSKQKKDFVLKLFYNYATHLPKYTTHITRNYDIMTGKTYIDKIDIRNYTKIELYYKFFENLKRFFWFPPSDLQVGEEIYMDYNKCGIVSEIKTYPFTKQSFTVQLYDYHITEEESTIGNSYKTHYYNWNKNNLTQNKIQIKNNGNLHPHYRNISTESEHIKNSFIRGKNAYVS